MNIRTAFSCASGTAAALLLFLATGAQANSLFEEVLEAYGGLDALDAIHSIEYDQAGTRAGTHSRPMIACRSETLPLSTLKPKPVFGRASAPGPANSTWERAASSAKTVPGP